MKELNDYFKVIINNKTPDNLYKPIDYILNQGGKRIRPQFVLMATELFGGDTNTALYPAAAFEMLHNFTLIHDDIMDNAPIRRGKETIFKKWNTNIAILSGDALATMAIQQILLTPSKPEIIIDLVQLISQTSIEICEGQQFDLNFETDNNVSLPDYINMIRLKTAVMLAGCLKAGAIISNASLKDQEAIYQFGIHFGIAFQLKDDLLDVYADQSNFGKINGGDIKDNKKTFLFLKSLELANPAQKNELLRYFSSTSFDFNEKFEAVKNYYNILNIKEITEKEIDNTIATGLDFLAKISVSPDKKELMKNMAIQLSYRIK